MGLKAALIVVTAGVGAYYAYTMMTSSEPASGTMHVPRLIASSASAAQPVAIEAIEAIVTEAPPPAPAPQPIRTGELIPVGIALPPTADKRPVPFVVHKGKLIKSAARSAMPSDYLQADKGKLIKSWAKPESLAKAVTRAPAPRPMKPMQHWLEAHQLA